MNKVFGNFTYIIQVFLNIKSETLRVVGLHFSWSDGKIKTTDSNCL